MSAVELREDEQIVEMEKDLVLGSSALAEAQDESKEDEEKEWLDVSPGKSSRSPQSKNKD